MLAPQKPSILQPLCTKEISSSQLSPVQLSRLPNIYFIGVAAEWELLGHKAEERTVVLAAKFRGGFLRTSSAISLPQSQS